MSGSWELQGDLQKMRGQSDSAGSVQYDFVCGEQKAPMATALGKRLSLKFAGEIHCQHCGRLTKKSFNQGFCFPCFRKLASCDSCIMAPEKCHFAAGTCREPEWAEIHCRVPHIVYLANSSGLKVGITRETQIPTRWIDQGAAQAIPLYRVAERRLSGLVEATLREWVSDRTQWQRMLKGEPEALEMPLEAERLTQAARAALDTLMTEEGTDGFEHLLPTPREFHYPVLEYPQKVRSLNPEKTPVIEGTLLGIKGQYLILDTGCLNVRKYTAYRATVTAE